jgi:DNA replication and repair protein RecF
MNKISGGREDLKIEYNNACDFITGTNGREIIYKQFYHNRDKDIYNGYATLGPHRDDIDFYINGKDAKKYGSQGQQRSAALSLKLSEIYLVKEMIGDTPVLLLDDVLSELDRNRQKTLLQNMNDIQTLITCTGLDELIENNFPVNRAFHIVNGSVESPGK